MTNLKQNWSERKMNIYWCRKICFVFFRAPGGKVWNLIKPFSGGAPLIRDSLNKQQVPCEHAIYTLQHVLSLHLNFFFWLKRAVVLETAEPFQFQPEATFSSRRSVGMRRMSGIFSIKCIWTVSFSIPLPKVQIYWCSGKHVSMLMSLDMYSILNNQICRKYKNVVL